MIVSLGSEFCNSSTDDVKSAAQLQVNAPLTKKTWERGGVVLVVKRKMAQHTIGRTFYLFHNKLLSKNIARRQLDGQHLLFGVYLQT